MFFLSNVLNTNFSIFWLSQFTATVGEFKSATSGGIVCPYLSFVIVFVIFTLLFESYCPEFFELSLETIITVLPGSIFHKSMREEIPCFVAVAAILFCFPIFCLALFIFVVIAILFLCFSGGGISVFLRTKKMESVLSL